jgi:hypothetical protein
MLLVIILGKMGAKIPKDNELNKIPLTLQHNIHHADLNRGTDEWLNLPH